MFLFVQNYVLRATLFAIDRARKKSLTSPRPVDAGMDRITEDAVRRDGWFGCRGGRYLIA